MSEIEKAIKALNSEGKTARAIATELYDRGLKNHFGKFLTPDMVEGVLRHIDVPPAELLPSKPGEYSKAADPIGEPLRKPRMLRPWPEGINYAGDNSYPDVPPYNFTHPVRYVPTVLRGASSAAIAVGGM